jgi:hypothetical protein
VNSETTNSGEGSEVESSEVEKRNLFILSIETGRIQTFEATRTTFNGRADFWKVSLTDDDSESLSGQLRAQGIGVDFVIQGSVLDSPSRQPFIFCTSPDIAFHLYEDFLRQSVEACKSDLEELESRLTELPIQRATFSITQT